jgi:hypothetical protein
MKTPFIENTDVTIETKYMQMTMQGEKFPFSALVISQKVQGGSKTVPLLFVISEQLMNQTLEN